MSLATLIAPHIPYLRRYARALCGNQESGDSYVAAVLEMLVENGAVMDSHVDPRAAVYRIFTSVWQSLSINMSEDEPGHQWEVAAERQLSVLTPMTRQAFLLVSVENFYPKEAAYILGIDETALSGLIKQAASDIARQIATDVLIIEDEPLIAMEIEALVQGLEHKVVGVARTQSEAVQMAEKYRPGLVLADIQLADGSSGVDAVNDILGSLEAPVIFITAFPERLLTGERPEPAFLITKPFAADMVKAIISQALFFDEKCRSSDRNAAA